MTVWKRAILPVIRGTIMTENYDAGCPVDVPEAQPKPELLHELVGHGVCVRPLSCHEQIDLGKVGTP
ncbi:hypothetical protein AB4Z09_27750 [Rhodococcus sp. TAF43]|uniref:hypothetical protein n=1 Tax=Rhodococcus sp. TAF43 TaxID=3237483 RepID=UPI003F99E85D